MLLKIIYAVLYSLCIERLASQELLRSTDLIPSSTLIPNHSTSTKSWERMKLTIAIMLPQDYIRLRNFNVCINKEMNRINKGNWSFTKHFYLDRFRKIKKKVFGIFV